MNSLFSAMAMENNEAQLLEDLMNDPVDNSGSGFSDQWNKMFGNAGGGSGSGATGPAAENLLFGESKKASNDIDDEFSNFVSSSGLLRATKIQSQQGQAGSDLLGLADKPVQPFLPSQLFDLDQSLYSMHSNSTSKEHFLSLHSRILVHAQLTCARLD